MREYLLNLLSQGKSLSVEEIFLYIAMAVAIGLVIYLSYWITHAGTIYSKKFNVSLVMLTVLTCTVMLVIGNNIALSLGMVGALSIVRYRTAIKDSRDTAYIFWAVIGGICCGATTSSPWPVPLRSFSSCCFWGGSAATCGSCSSSAGRKMGSAALKRWCSSALRAGRTCA